LLFSTLGLILAQLLCVTTSLTHASPRYFENFDFDYI
jgi:hypothetical protein